MDWEHLFEGELIPMVASARSESALEKAVSLILHALFRRTNDDANREQFWTLLQISLARANNLAAKVESAVAFLRLVKNTRKDLAAQSPNKRLDGGGVSSDLNAVAQTVVLAPVMLRPPPPPPPPARPASPPPRPAPSAPAVVRPSAPPPVQPAAASAAPAAEAAPEKVDFSQVFDNVVCNHLAQTLEILRIETPGSLRLPFMVHPAFGEVLERVVRTHVLPEMRNSRHIKTLADSLNVQEKGGADLQRILTAGEINNPILHTWDRRWEELAPRRLPGKTTKSLAPYARAVWKEFAEHGEAHGYVAPTAANAELFMTFLRYDLPKLRAAWREFGQHYIQEFRPGQHQEQARDGALRDALLKWEGREGMPAYSVEWLAIKAAASFPKLDLSWLARFSTNKGKTSEERERAIPFIMRTLSANA